MGQKQRLRLTSHEYICKISTSEPERSTSPVTCGPFSSVDFRIGRASSGVGRDPCPGVVEGVLDPRQQLVDLAFGDDQRWA